MGASKIDIYPDHINNLAAIAKVLAHPARITILQYISKNDNCICNDLVDKIGLSQPTISQHLQVINKSGLLKHHFKGKRLCYCIDVDRFQEFHNLINTFFNHTKSNCC